MCTRRETERLGGGLTRLFPSLASCRRRLLFLHPPPPAPTTAWPFQLPRVARGAVLPHLRLEGMGATDRVPRDVQRPHAVSPAMKESSCGVDDGLTISRAIKQGRGEGAHPLVALFKHPVLRVQSARGRALNVGEVPRERRRNPREGTRSKRARRRRRSAGKTKNRTDYRPTPRAASAPALAPGACTATDIGRRPTSRRWPTSTSCAGSSTFPFKTPRCDGW